MGQAMPPMDLAPAGAQSQRYTRVPLPPGSTIARWQIGRTLESRYDVADQPMQGEMDPFFFLTRHKNFIPHEYPCRTQFAAEHRGKRPEIVGRFTPERWWLPFGSPRLDISGFWFRPTRIANWAQAFIEAEAAGEARLRLATCGGAILWVNGAEAGWLAPYTRNLEDSRDVSVSLRAGLNELLVFFDDLAERDTRFFVSFVYSAGPPARLALPVPIDPEIALALEPALAGARFDRTAYFGEEVRVELPAPLPCDARLHVTVEGDFISGERAAFDLPVARGARTITLGSSDEMPADFRHFRLKLAADGFVAERTLAVEICHVGRQGTPPATTGERINEALEEAALHAEHDIVCALARLATDRGGPETDAIIASRLGAIEDCHDCADFELVPLIWARLRFGEQIAPPLRQRIDRAVLGYRYWMDEPGNDVQWYFSENHALLFHTAAYLAGHLLPQQTFVRSGRAGAEQSEVGAARVRAWLDHFERWEMAEFNSAPYFPIDLNGLLTLNALAPDADIRRRAGAAVVRLLTVVARSAHHGMLTAAQGRSYEHTLNAGRSLELSGMARLLWGIGWYGRRVHALPQLALALRDHGLVLPDLKPVADWRGAGAQEWYFAQGQDRFAALYHYKTADFAMGSVARYRWGEWGYQETLLHVRIGERPEAAVWINHPGEVIQFGFARPSYWGGCGTIARVHQYRALAVLEFTLRPEQPQFTHAWFPRSMFDAWCLNGEVAVARSDAGMLLLKGNQTLKPIEEGPTAGAELRLEGSRCRWIVRLGGVAEDGDLDAFITRFGGLDASLETDGALVVDDPVYGRVVFGADGRVEAEGRILDPSGWTIQGTNELFEAPCHVQEAQPAF